jgi:hypothetical protein
MAYSVTTNDGVTISVADETKDSSSLSLTVIGRNATNYGQSIVTNTIRHLENFASNVPPAPTYTLTGQLWYNKSEDNLRVYDGATWGRASKVPVSAAELSTDLVPGTQYFNSTEDKLQVYDGSTFRDAVLPGGTVTSTYSGNVAAAGGANNYGAKVETIFLESTEATAKMVPVIALKYVSDGASLPGELADSAHDSAGATVMAVFSDRSFTLAQTDPHYATLSDSGSFGATFTKGMNLRADYTDSTISLSDKSEWADKANAIYTGSVIPAGDIIHVGSTNWVPSGTVSTNYTLGTSSNKFGDLHVDKMALGSAGGTTETLAIVGTVNIGTSSNPVNDIYANNVYVDGTLDFDGVNSLTNLESADIDDVTLTSGTISSSPSGATDIANKSYVDSQASTATAAAITLVPTNTSTSTHFPIFVDSGSGNEQARTDTGFTYVPTSETLHTTIFDGTTGNFSGTVEANRFTDGTLSIENGDITSGSDATFSSTVTAGTLTDGSLSINSGSITGGASATFSGTVQASAHTGVSATLSGTVQAGSFTDGSMSITGGAITSASTGNFSGTVTANLFDGVASTAKYADLAEKYVADADYEPGTVVRIGGEEEITMTTEHADEEVFGVISTDPAYLMNSDIEGLPVALQGRVPVKVIGKVRKGERLISSDVPGVAWGVADATAPIEAVIGRALEDKDDGDQGMIEAVIGVK